MHSTECHQIKLKGVIPTVINYSKFCKNPFLTFWVNLIMDKQTHRDENITSFNFLVEIIGTKWMITGSSYTTPHSYKIWGYNNQFSAEVLASPNTKACLLTLKVLNFWKFTSNCSLKPLWSGMGEVVPARTSPTLHPPSPPTVHQLSRLAL